MKLSAPIYILKRQAKTLSRQKAIPLYRALDLIAKREGFAAWSLLAARSSADDAGGTVLSRLRPGDLVLLGARPGQGKTLLSLELVFETIARGRTAAFFSLDFTAADVARCAALLGKDVDAAGDRLLVDTTDAINAAYIVERLAAAPKCTLVVVDYLQALDQRRANPPLTAQVAELKSLARERGSIVLCLSQIDRTYDPASKPCPELGDVRLPNPLDLALFDKACFLHRGKLTLAATA